MDRLAAMQAFVAAVDEGSLSAAARRLELPLTTISRRVADLETHLGSRLLKRSTRRLSLTDAGEDYLVACRRILDEVDAAEREAAGEYRTPRGELTVAAPMAFGRLHVLPTVVDLLERFPEVDVRLALSDRSAHLLDDHIDVAVRIGPLPDSSLVAIPVGEVRPVVCASPAYLAAHGTPDTPAALAAHALVTFEALRMPTPWGFRDAGVDLPDPPRARLRVNTADAAIAAAAAGTGLTRVLSYQAADALRDGRLLRVLTAWEAPRLPIHVLYPRQGRLALKVRAFVDAIVPALRARLDER